VRADVPTHFSQHPWIIGQVGLRETHHNASLGEIPDPQPDFIADADCLAEPESLDLSIAWNVDKDVRPKPTLIHGRVR
jgi:hypothetical protein